MAYGQQKGTALGSPGGEGKVSWKAGNRSPSGLEGAGACSEVHPRSSAEEGPPRECRGFWSRPVAKEEVGKP